MLKSEVRTLFYTYTKTISKLIKYWNVRTEAVRHLEENKAEFNPDVAVGGGNHDADVASGYANDNVPLPEDAPPFDDDVEFSYDDEPKSPDEEIFGW